MDTPFYATSNLVEPGEAPHERKSNLDQLRERT